jgi:DNA-binding NarL/FixJ family response regulator
MATDPDRPAPLRIVVVDPDDRVRESLTRLIGIGDKVVVVGDAGQIGPALALAGTTTPDLIIIDPRLPDVRNGLDVIEQLRGAVPGVRILVMCAPDVLDDVAVRAAADGCIRKTFRPGDLLTAILAAAPLPA